jgi:hypothetical protein
MYLHTLSKRRTVIAALLFVLSTSIVSAQVNNVRFKGSVDGRETGMLEEGMFTATVTGGGIASHLGRLTLTLTATVELATGLSRGNFELAAASGDVLRGSFVGRGGPSDTPNVLRIVELMTITSGTGRFQGATGTFTLDRLVDQTTLPAFASTSGSLTGTISTPGSSK